MSKNLLLERMIAKGVNIQNIQEVFEFFHQHEASESHGLDEDDIAILFEQWNAVFKTHLIDGADGEHDTFGKLERIIQAVIGRIDQLPTGQLINEDQIRALYNQWSVTLVDQVAQVQSLAETNQLNLTTKVDESDFDLARDQIELNRLSLLNKADITALSMLTALVGTKADQTYVQEQIANLVNGDQSILNAINEISTALQQNEGLLEALDYTVANRVRFDVATQALTALQKSNARTNIGAEEVGTASALIAQITIQSLGGATASQGAKANTALQSADVAPVALSGLFSSLSSQNKIFDVVHSAYTDGANSVLTVTDTLGQMLGKLQAQIKTKSTADINWIDVKTIAVYANGVNQANTTLQIANVNGYLYLRGNLHIINTVIASEAIFSITNNNWAIMNRSDQCNIGVTSVMETFSTTIFNFYFNQYTTNSSMRLQCIQAFSSGTNKFFYFPPTNYGKLLNQ